MKNRKTSSILGLIALILVLTMMACVFAGCAEKPAESTGAAETTAPNAEATSEPTEPAPDPDKYTLYWNVEREQFAETGRTPSGDGYIHAMLSSKGMSSDFRVLNKEVATKLDTMSLVVIEVNAEGIIIDAAEATTAVPKVVVNKYYVTTAGEKELKTNSAEDGSGTAATVTLTGSERIYDVSGESTPIGTYGKIRKGDCIIAIANTKDVVTDVYIVSRVSRDVMQMCQHCDAEVAFKAWDDASALPWSESGHFYLTTDVQLSQQASLLANVEVILDLNGFTVTGNEGSRVYSVHNPGAYLAIMDASASKTGKLVPVGDIYAHGTCVFVRAECTFELFSGTLDSSGCTSTAMGGAVNVQATGSFNMYGGTIIGTITRADQKETKVDGGCGGAVYTYGVFNMNGGVIKDGGVYSLMVEDTKTYGNGGNIYVAKGAEFNWNAGEITGGKADNVAQEIYVAVGGTFTKAETIVIDPSLIVIAE